MRQETAKKLLDKVKKDYNTISSEFDQTRGFDWGEFELFANYIKDGDKVADLGCGNGRFYKFLKEERNTNYVGIDNSEKLLEKAQVKNPDAKFITGDLTQIPLKDASMDVCAAIASLHHIPSTKLRTKAIKEIHRVLKKDGIFIVTVWNLFQKKYKKYIWKSRIKALLSLGRYDFRDTMIPWGKSEVKRYYYAFKENELRKLLEKNNFSVIEGSVNHNIVFICRKNG